MTHASSSAPAPSPAPALRPIEEFYGYMARAFDFFNKKLFDDKLPPVLFCLHRKGQAFGYYHGEIFVRVEGGKVSGKADELALNPQHVATRKPEAVMATLVHEMVHHWQLHFGKRTSKAYHDKEWARAMKARGLYPSSTGEPGGKETGKNVSHYILAEGAFTLACDEFLKLEPPIFFQDRAALAALGRGGLLGGDDDESGEGEGEPEKKKSTGRAKFTCPECGLKATAKPSALLICGTCNKPMDGQDAK